MDKVNLHEKFAKIDAYWSPKVVGELNGQMVKLAKLKGEFVWHHHDAEDEMFMVVEGRLVIQVRDAPLPGAASPDVEREVALEPGEFLIIPRGVEHRPVAPEEVHVMLFEPAGTLNTGNVRTAQTQSAVERV